MNTVSLGFVGRLFNSLSTEIGENVHCLTCLGIVDDMHRFRETYRTWRVSGFWTDVFFSPPPCKARSLDPKLDPLLGPCSALILPPRRRNPKTENPSNAQSSSNLKDAQGGIA